ncbi:MAG TPA: hypothetical protein VFR70_03755 [Flavobacterium sp.]|nr:hypothetical protein [Flavobacterium sp.]
MSKTFLILFLSLLGQASKATECADRIFKEEHVNLYLCQNYSGYHESRALLFKIRTKILDRYISEKIKSGELQDKKFEIQLYDPILSYARLEISQGRKGCFVAYSDFATIQQLKTFIDYFANPGWKPFFTKDYTKATSEAIHRQIGKFFRDNTTKEAVLPQLTAWASHSLRLDYVNDTLAYFAGSTFLKIKAASSLPVKVRDRFLLFQPDAIFVLQGEKIIKTIKIAEPILGDYDIYSYPGWANICDGGPDNWVYSYSYAKNRFYRRPD